MQVARIEVDREVAKKALQDYRTARRPKTAQDLAIMQAYRAVAAGKRIIQARASVLTAGFNEDGSPKLALMRATATRVNCAVGTWGIQFSDARYNSWGRMHDRTRIRIDSWDGSRKQFEGRAIVPLIPVHLRPSNPSAYHILWEADWKAVPVDPMLLKKLSGDLWLVCAIWDLTDVERAVLGPQ